METNPSQLPGFLPSVCPLPPVPVRHCEAFTRAQQMSAPWSHTSRAKPTIFFFFFTNYLVLGILTKQRHKPLLDPPEWEHFCGLYYINCTIRGSLPIQAHLPLVRIWGQIHTKCLSQWFDCSVSYHSACLSLQRRLYHIIPHHEVVARNGQINEQHTILRAPVWPYIFRSRALISRVLYGDDL